MFEKLKEYFDKGKSMLEQALLEPEDDFVTVPEGVTCEQLIEEAKEYVDAVIVHKHDEAPVDEAKDTAEEAPVEEPQDTDEVNAGESTEEPAEDKNEQEG